MPPVPTMANTWLARVWFSATLRFEACGRAAPVGKTVTKVECV